MSRFRSMLYIELFIRFLNKDWSRITFDKNKFKILFGSTMKKYMSRRKNKVSRIKNSQ